TVWCIRAARNVDNTSIRVTGFVGASWERRERLGLTNQPRQLKQRIRSSIAPLHRALVRRTRLYAPKITAALIVRARLDLASGAVEDAIGHSAIATSIRRQHLAA